MPTLRAIASEMVRQLKGPEFWREETIASLTTTTIVSTANLAPGGWTADNFTSKFAWRPDTTTTADKVRYVTNYTASTGTLTHAGTNYADTTATGEKVIVTKVEPYIVRTAIDQALTQLRQRDRIILAKRRGNRYSLADFSWIQEPSDIIRICENYNPVISRNRYFQKRTPNTSAVWTPDDWTVSNNADTTPYEAYTGYKDLPLRYKLERAGGTNATLVQTVSTLLSGVPGDWPSGETITAAVYADPDTAGDVELSIADGTTTATSTGSGAGPQWITATLTLAQAAETLTLTVTAQTSNAAQIPYEAFVMVGAISDVVKRDDFPEWEIDRKDWTFDQYGGLTINTESTGNGQLVIYSKRPYPQFDSTRLYSGAADADETDAPLIPTAVRAVANVILAVEGATERYREWDYKAQQLQLRHMGGASLVTPRVHFGLMAPGPRRVR